MLVLSGKETEKTAGHSPLGWVKAAIAAAGVTERDSALDFGLVPVRCLEAGRAEAGAVRKKVRLSVKVLRPDGSPVAGRSVSIGATRRGAARILTAPLVDTRGGESYSATRLKTFVECPVKYYLSYVLGFGGASGQGPRDEPADTDREEGRGLAVLEGEITHQVLSEIDNAAMEAAVATKISALVRARHADPAAWQSRSPGRRRAEPRAAARRSHGRPGQAPAG